MKKIDLTKLVGALSIGALALTGCKSDPEPAPATETAQPQASSCGQAAGTPANGAAAPANGAAAPANGAGAAHSCGQH